MHYKVDTQKVLYFEECFQINGICFYVQKRLGRFAKEKQFSDCLEERAKELGIPCKRELIATDTGNRVDFVFFDKILVEIKAKPFFE